MDDIGKWRKLMSDVRNGTKINKLQLPKKKSLELVDGDGNNVLMVAAQNGHYELVNFFIGKVKIKEENTIGNNALMLAAKNGHTDVVELLIRHKGNVKASNRHGNNALMLAAMNGHLEAVILLIKKVKIQETNKNKNNALMLAAEKGHIDIVELLINHKGNVRATNNNGNNALMLAAKNGHGDLVEFLCEIKIGVRAVNNNKQNALMLAAKNGHTAVVKLLIRHKVGVKATDCNGNNALMLAAINGDLETVKRLNKLVDVKHQNSNGNNAVMIASEGGSELIVKLLIRRVDLTVANKQGKDALMIAAENNYLDIAKMLLDTIIRKHHVGYNYQKALHVTKNSGHQNIVQLIQNYSDVAVSAIHQTRRAINQDDKHTLIAKYETLQDVGVNHHTIESNENINVIYLVYCTMCDRQYVGLTKRHVLCRMNEHYKFITNGIEEHKLLYVHFRTEHTMDNFRFCILHRCEQQENIRTIEQQYIRDLRTLEEFGGLNMINSVQ